MADAPKGKLVVVAILVVIVTILALFLIQGYMNRLNNDDVQPEFESKIIFLNGDDVITALDCDIANTTEERQTGLMYVADLSEYEGMLFIQDPPRNVTLWMKNVEIPLDMIFVDENLRVVSIEEAAVELNGTQDSELVRYYSGQPVLYVIETNMGFCSENGIVPGTEITITFN